MIDPGRIAEIHARVAVADYAGAENICLQLADEQGSNPLFWQIRGDIALMAGNGHDAEAHYRWTTMLAPDAAGGWLGLARSYAATDRAQMAGAMAERALGLGLSGEHAAAAREITAHALFSRGAVAEGRAQLAVLAPPIGARIAAGQGDGDVLRAGLPPALCAGDAVLVRRILELTYSQAGALGPIAITELAGLEEWCKAAGVPCAVVEPPRKIKLAPTTPYSRADSYKTTAVLFASIPGGRWVPGWDFVMGSDGTVLADSGYLNIIHVFNHAPHAYFPAAKLAAHRAPAREEFIDADVLWLSAPMHNHMGHWLIDFLPRLIGRALANAPDLKIAIPETLTGAKFMEMLALSGVGEADLVRCRTDTTYRFRTLHVYRPGSSMPPNPTHVEYLYRLLRREPHPRARAKRFFLSRDRIASRLVINTDEFQQVLDDCGFVTVDLANHSVAEQQDLFAEAEIILGAIGTDLFAVYFAPPGCTIISMQWDSTWKLDAYLPQTCAMLGMRHQFLLCPTTRTARNSRSWLDLDFVVDCAELRRRIGAL